LGPPLSYSASRFPEPAGNLDRVNACLLPPRALVAGAMHRPVMPATEWDRELIADLATERARLGKSEVVGVRGLAAAQ
jgi:diadenosine tetraphosphatase ApaH/serine/threonine PP2A family protein phosphatase